MMEEELELELEFGFQGEKELEGTRIQGVAHTG